MTLSFAPKRSSYIYIYISRPFKFRCANPFRFAGVLRICEPFSSVTSMKWINAQGLREHGTGNTQHKTFSLVILSREKRFPWLYIS